MEEKFKFYRRYGVKEYYLYDPETHELCVWLRSGRKLVPVAEVNGWVSPNLKVRFEASGTEPWKIIHPDGAAFRTYLELLADNESERNRANEASQRANEASQRAALLAARLRELGVDPDTV